MLIYTKNSRPVFALISATMLAVFIFTPVFAQNNSTTTDSGATETSKQQQKEQLRRQLQELENELSQLEAEKNKYNSQAESYERDISLLENDIRRIQIQIRQSELILRQTSNAIETNREALEDLEKKIERQKELLSKLLLSIYKMDDTSAVEIILTSQSLSEFFNDINSVKNLQKGMAETLAKIQEIKKDIEAEQAALEHKSEQQAQLLQLRASQQTQVASKVDQKEALLEESRSKEYQISQLANQKRKTIGEVRSQIFRLEGAGVAVNFEDAYNYAKDASALSGVRPAFLLSILKQESSWGKNVGLCKLYNKDNGDGIGVNTGTIYPRTLKVGRDIEPFFQITQSLGRDPYDTRISCWPQIYYDADGDGVRETPYGYGGAMGPAQFLPSTWMGYKDRVSQLVGETADPWNILHAFVASGVKLAAAGATSHDYNSEWCAALIYYSGRCPGNSINHFYANQVMERAAQYQQDIDILEGR